MKYEGLEELVVVASFGEVPQQIESALDGAGVVVTHVRDATGLEAAVDDGGTVGLVLVDRWLLGDGAGRSIAFARRERGIPCVLLVSDSASLGTGRSDIGSTLAESVDAVLEKPVTAFALEAAIAKALGARGGDVKRFETAISEPPLPDHTPPELAIEPPPPSGAPAEPTPSRPSEPPSEPPSATPRTAVTGPVWAGPEDPENGPGRLLAEVRETLRRLTDVIQYDSLTGLLHRDFFLERATHEERSAKRSGLPLSVLMIDVDDFKAVNDEHGHDAGNEVLGQIGEAIRATIREDLDLASRLYGDEFAILLPATPVAGAVRLAERLQQRLAETPGAPTISVGCHGLAGADLAPGIQGLMESADQALVDGKRQAKGGITVFGAAVVEPEPTDEADDLASPADESGPSEALSGTADADGAPPASDGTAAMSIPDDPADDAPVDTAGDTVDDTVDDTSEAAVDLDAETRPDDAAPDNAAPDEPDVDARAEDSAWPMPAISPLDAAPPPRPEGAHAPGGPMDAESEVGQALSGMAADASRVAQALARLADEEKDDEDDLDDDIDIGDLLDDADDDGLEETRAMAAGEIEANDGELLDLEPDADVAGGEDPLAVALAEAVGALADESDLREVTEFRGRALFVSDEPDVAAIVVEFLRGRGMAVDVVPDFAAALTALDTLEYFAAFADGPPDRPDVAAFVQAGRRIDPALFFFLFVAPADNAARDPGTATPPLDARSVTVPKPFLLSELFLRASRAREDYHLMKERVSKGAS